VKGCHELIVPLATPRLRRAIYLMQASVGKDLSQAADHR
jgi:hypothetical protein